MRSMGSTATTSWSAARVHILGRCRTTNAAFGRLLIMHTPRLFHETLANIFGLRQHLAHGFEVLRLQRLHQLLRLHIARIARARLRRRLPGSGAGEIQARSTGQAADRMVATDRTLDEVT